MPKHQRWDNRRGVGGKRRMREDAAFQTGTYQCSVLQSQSARCCGVVVPIRATKVDASEARETALGIINITRHRILTQLPSSRNCARSADCFSRGRDTSSEQRRDGFSAGTEPALILHPDSHRCRLLPPQAARLGSQHACEHHQAVRQDKKEVGFASVGTADDCVQTACRAGWVAVHDDHGSHVRITHVKTLCQLAPAPAGSKP